MKTKITTATAKSIEAMTQGMANPTAILTLSFSLGVIKSPSLTDSPPSRWEPVRTAKDTVA